MTLETSDGRIICEEVRFNKKQWYSSSLEKTLMLWCTACSETGWYQGADGEDLIFIFKFLSNEHIWFWYWKKMNTVGKKEECLGPRS